jgi:hypothetical protein
MVGRVCMTLIILLPLYLASTYIPLLTHGTMLCPLM